MATEKYSIGGTVLENEAFEAFADIPQNRVLLAEKLTNRAPVRPEVVGGLTNIDEVFEHFKPEVEVEFETEAGTSQKEMMRFRGLGDFGIKGITPQSTLLNDLTLKREQFQKINKQLKTNKLLKQALSDSTTKESLILALNALIQELETSK
ncbi:Type VI secretion system, VipA, VC_A0107 or Hcp2 [Aquiflexum balticum DSM 16537]|uniref:Type VI secretion system, VipA, VC_A0107 or Hcp2 n=1 Tax=Aquiflexum balticum DSM 16537 TaxID=758820 RepID=A0A1W2H6J9_9BACT|nr:type VI secretion system contractile sheath small subunit [Aquiflexum balticum]SMD44116.1 Type VI secretion system, VipA, VC_A0107 or Hcp2 [Aquiflexum balticum DSM 16537]